MSQLRVRPAGPADRATIDALHDREWGGPYVIGHDVRYDLRELPTLVAVDGAGGVCGALAWHLDDAGLEVVSVVADKPGSGVGTALLAGAAETARAQGADRLWLITSNDNLRALRFYQRRGLRIVAVDPGAVDRARLRKPSIPTIGADGIPLHDELRLELRLLPAGSDAPA
ncbi:MULTISPECIES: N-acetyltransferase [unclassified Plantactinospora]|uniref:GNAT family N-acetyltransferase n=1 Tax=unclassified Plantactinospora TaxID=2631981 RepID=UPI000D172616|nr:MULTISPECIES: GNAT family N-acetyltransferase [unclassified Plantactinospora]AVT30671.1 GNAT family N-acetyltransferase [Plantactinospora sp. BC1]AVT37516.1 GNAT family N-acetyltransferase [Plantactinospora sp. BB1]